MFSAFMTARKEPNFAFRYFVPTAIYAMAGLWCIVLSKQCCILLYIACYVIFAFSHGAKLAPTIDLLQCATLFWRSPLRWHLYYG